MNDTISGKFDTGADVDAADIILSATLAGQALHIKDDDNPASTYGATQTIPYNTQSGLLSLRMADGTNIAQGSGNVVTLTAVSYTHLTLPTKA